MFIKRGKKASLSLSMNAIVIIILAVTMLGLGLTFMRTFMGKGTESLSKVFEGSDLEKRAGPLEPLTIDESFKFKSGESEIVKIGFYCDTVLACDSFKPFVTSCEGNFADTDLTLTTPKTDIGSRKDVGFKGILDHSGTTGSAICTFVVGESNAVGDGLAGNPTNSERQSKQVLIEVS